VASPRKARFRFFIDPACIDSAAGLARCDEARLSHQVRNVLRLKKGDWVQLLDGLGHLWEAELVSAGRTFIEFSLEPPAAVTLKTPPFRLLSCLPLIKAQRFEWALEKLCELGVSQILPFQSERCTVKLKATEAGRAKRWLTICKEACEQSERLFLPELLEPISLARLLDEHGQQGSQSPAARTDKLKLLLSERNEKAPDMVSTLYNQARALKEANQTLDVLILSGPEGGFSDDELKSIAAHDFCPVSLGDLILRSETACILAAGVVSALNIRDY